MECVASIILSVALAITGAGIGYSGIKKIFSEQYNTLSAASGIALTAAVLSIVIKEWMYWFTRIAEGVHQTIENNFPQCKHCMVHVNTNELLYSA